MWENKFEIGCKQLFYPVFTVSFLWVILNTIFANPFYDYRWYVSLPLMFLWLGILFGIYKITEKSRHQLIQKKWLYLGAFFVILTITQCVFYYLCAGYPTRDFERVFTGAYNYTITGEILDPYLDYFYKYPNNMPLTIILQFIFRVFYKLGFTQFFIIGALFNAVCIDLTYLLLFLIIEKITDTQKGFFALWFLYLCLPLQTYISIFYTDTTSMLFPVFIVYLYLRLKENSDGMQKLICLILMGLVAGLGIKIKYSVIIALIAVLVECILRFDFKKIIGIVLSVALGFAGVSFVIDGFMYKNILDKELAYDRQTPFVAWIAMGLQGDGMHSPVDNFYIWSQETHEEKVDAANYLLTQRLKEMGPIEYIKFLNRKAVRSFGSGDFDYPNTVSDSPMKQNFMIDLLNNQGKYYTIYDNIIQGYHLMVFCLLMIGGLLSFTKRDDNFFVPQLSAFGMLLFLLIWESGTRYLLNYYPIFILCALMGFFGLFSSSPTTKIYLSPKYYPKKR